MLAPFVKTAGFMLPDLRPWWWATKQAARSLRRAPAFTFLALLTLTLGTTAALLVLLVAKAVLWNPLPFPEADRLVMVWERAPTGEPRNMVSSFNLIRWQSRSQAFKAIGAVLPLTVNISGFGEAEQVDGLAVTSGFFDALAVTPILGHTFSKQDDATRPPRVVVLGYAFWKGRYKGATNVIGKTLMVNGGPREIVGVMPDRFAFPAARTAQIYTSFPLDPAAPPGPRSLITVARLKDGVTLDAAAGDMARVTSQLAAEAPAADRGFGASIFPLLDETVGAVRRPLVIVSAAVGCLLLLTCVNVVNLLLIRSARRQHETALRLALGAGRGRIAQHFCAEGTILSMSACGISVLTTSLVFPRVPVFLADALALPRAHEIQFDIVSMAVTIGLSVAAGLAFGLLQVAYRPRAGLADSLKAGSRSGSIRQQRLRHTLVVVEVAAAVLLVFAAVLMGRSFGALIRVDPGFDTARVFTFRTTLIPRKYARREQVPPAVERMLAEVRAVPGVAAAGSIHFLPLSGIASGSPVYRADRPAPPRDQLPSSVISVISPGYFQVMGIPLRGRDFDDREKLDSPGAVIINEALARRDFPGEDPVGHHVTVLYGLKSDFEIVGVAGDVRTSTLDQVPAPTAYLPASQEPSLDIALVVRSDRPIDALVPAVREAVAHVDPEQGIRAQGLAEVIASAVARPRVEAGVIGGFGGLALLVAAVGLYGVIAYSVEQRRRELGIALALGAAPRWLFRKVIGEGLRLTAAGVVLGLSVAWLATDILQRVVFSVSARDPVTFGAVTLALLGVAVIASVAPAMRALRVDPLVVLRNE